ncbi:hypothetical protein ACFP2F_22600 [Hymenobacter artigasi]|uniref:Lipocalin-like domain-containing protein n=1 Tax=Hymenobacter artigasi TaxID=2719616 RepID=A0ABX1HQ33_9BACT|nr:hypothetical protein [Hymenobacter artigasi]NKI92005.1 hypothetical protein [Hymenobacter artigasi]
MTKRWCFLLGSWAALTACQRRLGPTTTPLEARWKLQSIVDSTFTKEGRLRAREELPLKPSSHTHLLIAKRCLVYQKRGDRSFALSQPYTRQGDNLRIVSADTPPGDPVLVTIAFLDAHRLVLRLVQPYPPGWRYDYSTYTSFYTR